MRLSYLHSRNGSSSTLIDGTVSDPLGEILPTVACSSVACPVSTPAGVNPDKTTLVERPTRSVYAELGHDRGTTDGRSEGIAGAAGGGGGDPVVHPGAATGSAAPVGPSACIQQQYVSVAQ